MEKEKTCKPHIMVLVIHVQGHINPLLEFSKRLVSKGMKITVATELSVTKTMKIASSSGSITFESIYDDDAEGGIEAPGGFKGFLDRFEATGSRALTELIIKKQENSTYPIKCFIYDVNILWASNIAKQFALPRVAFLTHSCAFAGSIYPIYCELSEKPLSFPAFPVPGLPPLRPPDLPSFGDVTGRDSVFVRHICSQFDNMENENWVLFNSFYKLEEEVVNWMSNLWSVRTIGPTVPSVYLDNRVENDNNYGFNLFKPSTEVCLQWLNTKEAGSVVYVSFGSFASLSAAQIAEMVEALKQIPNNFLWVVKPAEETQLPVNFVNETLKMGLVVTWCPQLEVLAHKAVGCFISHCGWNSTVEAISFGVPVVAMPQAVDQLANAYFVEKVWGVGIQAKEQEERFSTAQEIGRCINEVMNGEKGKEIKKKAKEWKALAKEAINENGSSDKCIDEIVSWIVAL